MSAPEHRDDLGTGIVLVPNPRACGLGRGAECCAYLVFGAGGGECARDTEIRSVIETRVRAGTFTARRLPLEPLFECQVPAWDES